MLLDAERRDDGWFRDAAFDVAVCGAGPAGITLARRLGERGWRVGLFEGGGLEETSESQDLYDGDVTGQDYFPLDVTRLRFLGGSSNHWGGWTRPLDAVDFRRHSWHPLSGWPIRKSDLAPYTAEADRILDLKPWPVPPDLFHGRGEDLVPITFRWSPPTRFGPKYRAELQASPNIRLYLHANLVDIRLTDSHAHVASLTFRSYDRPDPFSVRARYVVLCLGGIENPRMLLNASSQEPAGIGNGHDLVGRFFTEHPHSTVARAVLREPLPKMDVYEPTPEMMARDEILNFGLRVVPEPQPKQGPARPADFAARLAAAIRNPAPAAFDAHVLVASEQSLNRESRVRLEPERDRFGLRKAALEWRLSKLDFRTIGTAAHAFATRLAETDLGRARISDWLKQDVPSFPKVVEDEVAGNHHMCTTRMSDDPRTGVVDRDCRVHGIDNFYVGGSSVFATGGHANPTYTIVQLVLRLSDHLHRRLKVD